MTRIIAVLSMLHESATRNSATRQFRDDPVLRWTLNRLARAKRIDATTLLCWDDQLSVVAPFANEVSIKSQGEREPQIDIDPVTVARRWSDGWRGGLLGSCEFDLGFSAVRLQKLITPGQDEARGDKSAIVMIDPAAALIDSDLIDSMIEHAAEFPDTEIFFHQAAPGLGGVLLRPALIERLAKIRVNPGRLLSYVPDQPVRDMISTDSAAPVPTPVARTMHRFKLDSDRQIDRLARATSSLNGQLISSGGEDLVARMNETTAIDALPRDVVLELNTSRNSNPIFWPGRFLEIKRPDLSIEVAEKILIQLARADDVRLTIAGVGDPLESENLFPILAAAKNAGVSAINVETDLLTTDPKRIEQLASSGVDIVSVHLPAATARTYEAVMGVGALGKAVENLRALMATIQKNETGLPLVVPIFVKTQINLGEMEAWYDHWLRTFGHASILGPSDFAGQIPDASVADMAPPRRRPCARISSRMTILSDGRVASCEQDVSGKQILGDVSSESIQGIWQNRFTSLREDHKCGQWIKHPLCAACKEWHRP